MMETKLWAALCALLLVNLGSADYDESHIAPSNASNSAVYVVAPEAPAAVPVSSLDSNGSGVTSASQNTSLTVTSSLSSNTSTERQNIPLTPEKMENNGSSTIPQSEATTPERHLTQPPSPPSGSHTPTTHTALISSTTSAGHSVPVNSTSSTATSSTTTSSTTTSSTTTFSITQSNQSTNNQTHLFPSATTHELANQETTTTTTTIIQSSSTSSTSSTQEPTGSLSQTHASPQNTVPTEASPSKTSTAVHQKPTTPPESGPSIQPRIHVDTSSKLKVGGDTTMVHESPTLDPLLAGLVSAFIITAVIITLLLFLKLRRRDNRPEFRRLQDLPMDDMEDTPLSMYSY